MKPDKDKDITERMVEMLRKHSLPYKEGAWERFKEYETRTKKKVVIWPYLSGAAAVVLLAMVLFFKPDEFDESSPTIVESVASVEIEKPVEGDVTKPSIQEDAVSNPNFGLTSPDNKLVNHTPSAGVEESRPLEDDVLIADVSSNQQRYAFNSSSDRRYEKSVQADDAGNQQTASQNKNEEQGLVQPNRTYEQEKAYSNGDWALVDDHETDPNLNQYSGKWDFSIELAPNINERQQVNFGGGVAVAYNINDKISISSGVSYVQLDAQRGPNRVDIPAEFAKASLNSYNYNKSLNTINTTLVGLDIPVNLKVNLGSQVYASAGVSLFSVLSESRYNVFEEKITQVASLTADGKSSPEPAIQTVYSQEANPDTPYEGKNFTGFFNLSVGYKLPVLKNLNLSVEPYLKVPVGSLTDQDMNLGNGGLKIVTSF